jgi:outer membrane protein assembly factor BamD
MAMSHFRQMRAPERDQTETRDALKEFDVFFPALPEQPPHLRGETELAPSRDRLSEASYRVGMTYYRSRWYPGAIDRFREVLRDDPGYTGRDAVYFYLAESLAKTDKRPEAIPYFERLVSEFDQSEYLEDAKKRLQELKNQ